MTDIGPGTVKHAMALDLEKQAIKDDINAAYTDEIEKDIHTAIKETQELIKKNDSDREAAEERYEANGKKKTDRDWLKNLAEEKKALETKVENLTKNAKQSQAQAHELRTRAKAYRDKADFVRNYDPRNYEDKA